MDARHHPRSGATRRRSKRLVHREGRRAGRHGDGLVATVDVRILKPKVQRIIRALETAYGRPTAGVRKDPLSELVFTILSQNTSDLNRDRAWVSLWKSFRSWDRIATAPRIRVEAAIRVGGLAPTKSRVIQEVLRQVRRAEGDYTLESLRGVSMDEVESFLRSFKGVGLKTIRCVQVFSLGQPAFPVDTHIFRITKRLGLVPARANPEAAHRIMQALTPPSEVLPFHINLITHGRRVCRAQRPLCGECVVRRMCPYYLERMTDAAIISPSPARRKS